MVLTSDGEILTNNHVIDGATSISVTDVGNGKTYTRQRGRLRPDPRRGRHPAAAPAGSRPSRTASGTAAVGQAVVGIGNAGGTGGHAQSRRAAR